MRYLGRSVRSGSDVVPTSMKFVVIGRPLFASNIVAVIAIVCARLLFTEFVLAPDPCAGTSSAYSHSRYALASLSSSRALMKVNARHVIVVLAIPLKISPMCFEA